MPRTTASNRIITRNQSYSLFTTVNTSYLKTNYAINPSNTIFSIGIWVLLRASVNLPTLLAQLSGSGTGRAYLYWPTVPGVITTVLDGTAIAGTKKFTQNKWYFIGISSNFNIPNVSVYYGENGAITQDINAPVAPSSNDGNLIILNNRILSNKLDGFTTEYRIFTGVAFSAAEWLSYYRDNSFSRTGLQQELLFSEGTGTTVADTSGNGMNATFNNTPQWSGVTFSKLKTAAVGRTNAVGRVTV